MDTRVECLPKKRRNGWSFCTGRSDVLIPQTLIFGAQHGQGIARAIQQTSDDESLVEHGALYPALQRLEERGWISAKWGISRAMRVDPMEALRHE